MSDPTAPGPAVPLTSLNTAPWIAAWLLSVALCGLAGFDYGRGHISPTPPPAPVPGPFVPPPAPPLPTPTPVPPASDFFRLGASLKSPLIESYSASLDQVATQLAAGVAVPAALAASDPLFKAARAKSFDLAISPALSAIAPDPAHFTDDQRAHLVTAFRDLARGVSGK